MIKRVQIKNFKSIKNLDVSFNRNLFVLAGQNESGKSSILEAIRYFYSDEIEMDTLNFELEGSGKTSQEITLTFFPEDPIQFFSSIGHEIEEHFPDLNDYNTATSDFSKIVFFELTRSIETVSGVSSYRINEPVLNILKRGFLHKLYGEAIGSDNPEENDYLSFAETNLDDFCKVIIQRLPRIVFFDEQSQILPDKIPVRVLADEDNTWVGYQAVKNLEVFAGVNFVEIAGEKNSLKRLSKAQRHSDEISLKFQNIWRQRIFGDNEIKIQFKLEHEDLGTGDGLEPVFLFYVETKDKELLEPRKRSKGLIWFLSNWLSVNAIRGKKNLLFLYDEPGLFLHVKAHEDMLLLFKELVAEGHQIVYSTHSPTLIDLEALDNIGLVLNSKAKGTTVESLTSSSFGSPNKKDALQPIANAMGLEPLKEFTIFGSKKSVIVEGISDFWYFQGMAMLMGLTLDYKFVPGVGILETQVKPLISFCIGYDLTWLLVMDNGANPQKIQTLLSDFLYGGDKAKTDAKIHLVPFKEIEDIFTEADLKMINPKIKAKAGLLGSAIIGEKNKAYFSRLFMSKVKDQTITLNDLDPNTVKTFQGVFDWIENSFKI